MSFVSNQRRGPFSLLVVATVKTGMFAWMLIAGTVTQMPRAVVLLAVLGKVHLRERTFRALAHPSLELLSLLGQLALVVMGIMEIDAIWPWVFEGVPVW